MSAIIIGTTYRKCPICRLHMADPDDHTCPPSFYVLYPEHDGDEPTRVFAYTEDDAVRKWAEDFDATDFDIARDALFPRVLVWKFGQEERKDARQYDVHAERVTEYVARKVTT